MKKSCCPWSTSVPGMASSQSSSSWRRWMWTGRMPTLCLPFWGSSSPPPAMTPHPWWPTPSSSSGARCAETTWPGTLRSFWWGRTGRRSSGTAGGSSPATWKETSRSSSAKPSNIFKPSSASLQLHLCFPAFDGCFVPLLHEDILWKRVRRASDDMERFKRFLLHWLHVKHSCGVFLRTNKCLWPNVVLPEWVLGRDNSHQQVNQSFPPHARLLWVGANTNPACEVSMTGWFFWLLHLLVKRIQQWRQCLNRMASLVRSWYAICAALTAQPHFKF